ncbi:MAG: replicative DNA helicase [Myxococcota bacterium]
MSDSNVNIPYNPQAEKVVLGSLMLGAVTYSDVILQLNAEDFFSDYHKELYGLIKKMFDANEPVDVTSVATKAIQLDLSEKLGGISYVTSLVNQAPATQNIDYYATIVSDNAIKRRLVAALEQVKENTLNSKEEVPLILDFAEQSLFGVTQEKGSTDWHVISDVVDTEFKRIQSLQRNASDVTGFTTGFVDLDQILAGLHRTDLFILAARPAMGKTAFVLNLALNAARTDVGVAIFSLEMSVGQLVTRLLCTESRVDAGKVRTGKLAQDDIDRLIGACNQLYHLPIYMDDSPGLNITQVRSKARRLAANNPDLGVIVVDYIGLMGGDPKISRQEQVSASSRGLKALAKELNVCVIALSQLNRGVEQRQDKRPVPSDLRESGAIEQDADIISFIYRDEYYNEDTTEPGVAEIIIAKQRNGATGTVKLAFTGKHTRFDNLALGYHGEYH